jgi:muconolactone delta-isomerase
MDFLVVVRPRSALPIDHIAMMLGASRQWYQRHQSSFRSFGTFPGGGGFAVLNVTDVETLHRMMAEMPFTAVSDVHIDPFIEGEAGFAISQEIFEAMAQNMRGA